MSYRSNPARRAAFAKRLREIMDERGLSQSDVAAKIWGKYTNTENKHVARGRDRISVWLSGKTFPDDNNLEKLAKALRVERSDLASDDELQALDRSTPTVSIVLYSDNRALVSINQVFPLKTALEIMAIAGTVGEK
jgi:transcriptional regulator with XRE-family HTH domain